MENYILILLLVLSLLGMTNASYLIISRYNKKPLACPINHQCNEVVQ